MKITVTQEKLAKALNNVSRVAASRVTLPVLNNVLLKVEKNVVSLITTNLDLAVVDFLPVSSSEDGTITVPAKLLAEFISNLPRGENVEISSNDTKVEIRAGKYSSVMNGTLADDFPALPEIDEKSAVVFKVGIDEFKNSVNQVIVAASTNLDRPALTGVLFETKDKNLFIAATDGYRVAEKKLIKNVQSDVRVIVPAASLQEVLRAISEDMDEVEISFNDDLVRFRLGEIEVVSKLIDAAYPDYRQLIQTSGTTSLTLNRDEFSRVAKLAALFARRSASGSIVIEAKTPDTFSVKSVMSELGENDSIITTKIDEDAKVNLNSRYLLDALNALDEPEITLDIKTGTTPITLKNAKNPDYTHIILPLNA